MKLIQDDAVIDAIVAEVMELQDQENTTLPLLEKQKMCIRDRWNGWKVYYYADDMVEFCTGSFGLIPSTTYKGFYYSEDDEPHGFQAVSYTHLMGGIRLQAARGDGFGGFQLGE